MNVDTWIKRHSGPKSHPNIVWIQKVSIISGFVNLTRLRSFRLVSLSFHLVSLSFSLVHSRFLSFCLKTSKYVDLNYNHIDLHRFLRHLKNARSNLASALFLDLFLSHSPLIETFCRSKLLSDRWLRTDIRRTSDTRTPHHF